MTAEQTRKLKGHLKSLSGLQRLFEECEHQNCEGTPVKTLSSLIRLVNGEFPHLLPEWSEVNYYSHGSDGDLYYKVRGILSYLAVAIGTVEANIEPSGATPVTEVREFSFVGDRKLRAVLERDYAETQRAFIAGCWKSAMILCGSMIEAILLDKLLQNESVAKSSTKAPSEKDLGRWDLARIIDVAVDLGYVAAGVEKMSHSVRDYRNLIHPGNEIRTGLKFDREESRIAIEVLHLVHRDLSS